MRRSGYSLLCGQRVCNRLRAGCGARAPTSGRRLRSWACLCWVVSRPLHPTAAGICRVCLVEVGNQLKVCEGYHVDCC